MARKAVQGYPEKSYYDNTRYLGIVATTDPLNEGLFKHMVNFDVSDTGQSVEPREGFLSTTLKNTIPNTPTFNQVISLSKNTIIYKDGNLGAYILYDFSATPNSTGKAYIANISGYDVQNYYLPIVSEITNYDWSELFLYTLAPQLSWVANSIQTIGIQQTITSFRPYITPIPDTKVEHIYDENGISCTLIKARLSGTQNQVEPFDFILRIKYRKNAVGTLLADTLIFDGLPEMFNHPTLVPTDRNLAVSKSIIPNTFQTLYTQQTRPSGHISTLGNFVYVYDDTNRYVNNLILNGPNYNIKPYFVLNPAYIEVGNTPNSNDKWAYRVEFFNTGFEIGDTDRNTVFSTAWLKYENNTTKPSEVFVNNRLNQISLGNTNQKNNHYKNARYIIYVIVKHETIPNNTNSSQIVTAQGQTITSDSGRNSNGVYDVVGGETYLNIYLRWINWRSEVLKINDLKSLLNTIETLNNTAYFYFYDLHSDVSEGIYKPLDEAFSTAQKADLTDFKNNRFIFDKETMDEKFDLFLTGEELIKIIKEKNVFKNKYDIAFSFLPFVSNDTYVETNEIISFASNPNFGTLPPYYKSGTGIAVLPDAKTEPFGTVIQTQGDGKLYKRETIQVSNIRSFNLTTGSATITNGATEGILAGDLVTGTGIQNNTQVSSVVNSTTLILNKTATQTITSSLTFPEDANNEIHPLWNEITTNPQTTIKPNTPFVEGAIYKDTRDGKHYKWNNPDGYNGKLGRIVTPSASAEHYRFVLCSIPYWTNGAVIPYDYIIIRNNFFTNQFKFITFENNQYILNTSLNTLKIQTIDFESSVLFGSQIPEYRFGSPVNTGLVRPFNWIIGVPGFQNYGSDYYKQTTAGTGSTWSLIGSGDSLISFTNLSYYRDLRTNKVYRWNNSTGLTGSLSEVLDAPYVNLVSNGFFDKGFNGIIYMRPYRESELVDKTFDELLTLEQVWNSTALTQTFNLTYGYDNDSVTYITEQLTTEPEQIKTSNNLIVFEDSRLLIWNKNVLYISEEGRFYWFKERTKIEFAEEIVKVLQYKQIILVFTTQHLYAVYRVETTVTQLNPATNQIEQNVTGVAWLKQIVLYNLLVKKEYADVIQIFNQMVLFYSEDGQLFMIRPSSQIDDQTRFSIQYFNKAANDILINYDVYINERLASYGSTMRVKKDEVKIKALVSINFIKIIYYVPGVITYMLIYDVINNRYIAHDSLTFTDVFDKWFIESGDLFVTQQNNKLYFTLPYVEPNIKDNHVDMSFTNNFKKEGINCLIDTGNLNLNNHLYKRFRDLHVTFKNLNASNVLFNVETMIDEVIAKPFYNEQLQVIDSNNISYYVTVKKENNKDLIELVDVNQISEQATDVVKYSLTNNLFENNNMLMDFSEYTSSKLLTHRTSILGLGKVFRIKLQFISKGLYKLQGFGIIYKERRI